MEKTQQVRFSELEVYQFIVPQIKDKENEINLDVVEPSKVIWNSYMAED